MKLDKEDWYTVLLALLGFFVAFGWLYSLAYTNDKENKKPIEERLSTEEFRYKGHQYIMFETNRPFDGISVVHDPNCECQSKKDSI